MTVLYIIQSLCQPNYGYGKEEQDDDQRGGLMGEWHRALKGKDYWKEFIFIVIEKTRLPVYRYPFAKIPGISSAGKGRLNK